jgi:hypothetical protein
VYRLTCGIDLNILNTGLHVLTLIAKSGQRVLDHAGGDAVRDRLASRRRAGRTPDLTVFFASARRDGAALRGLE